MDKFYLRMGDDYLEDAVPYRTKQDAISAYTSTARALARFDQRIEASIHIAASRAEVNEYPDFVLSLGARGGVRCDPA